MANSLLFLSIPQAYIPIYMYIYIYIDIHIMRALYVLCRAVQKS